MSFSIFINFNGNCRQAVTFYADVFGLELPQMMTFRQAPTNPDFPVSKKDIEKILYTSLMIHGVPVMLSDVPEGQTVSESSNISITISSKDKKEIERLFDRMKEGGTVFMDLQETFFSDCYGMVTDSFGVTWLLNHEKN